MYIDYYIYLPMNNGEFVWFPLLMLNFQRVALGVSKNDEYDDCMFT
jgi:hypothetical protein